MKNKGQQEMVGFVYPRGICPSDVYPISLRNFVSYVSNKIFLTALPRGHPRLKILFATCSIGKNLKKGVNFI